VLGLDRNRRAPQPRTLRRAAAAALTAGVAIGLSTALGPAGAAADPVSGFYVPPASFDSTPGAVIRNEPLPILATVPGGDGTWPAAGRQVLYTSTTQDGAPVAVSGTFVDTDRPWTGAGPRPTVVIAPGTSGQGDHCAVSAAFQNGMYVDISQASFSANQEILSAAAWSAMGARVFVTDHIGLGTPGVHTYVNNKEGGHAVLDAARAANALSGGSGTPIVLWGYSQGGGATAAAAEMQPTYAPEVNLKGTWAGGPTANLIEILGQVDGSLIGGVVGFALNGFLDRNPELRPQTEQILSPRGLAFLDEMQDSCIGDVILKHPFLKSSTLTVDGRPLLDHFREMPDAVRTLDAQRIGRLTPASPVLITSGINDDTVPYAQARQLAEDWCAKGATVGFDTNDLPPILPGATIPNHFGPQIADGYMSDKVVSYLLDRLADKPVSGCTFN
jgi:hypothetical protein